MGYSPGGPRESDSAETEHACVPNPKDTQWVNAANAPFLAFLWVARTVLLLFAGSGGTGQSAGASLPCLALC